MTTLDTPPAEYKRREHRFTVDEYLRMVGTGILTDRDKVELIDGRIVDKMPRNPPHEASLHRVFSLLMRVCPPEWTVRVQSTLRCKESAPEPDVMVLRGPVERYDEAHPVPSDLLLVVEIADSSLREDRRAKVALYGGDMVAAYWIVNLVDRCVEVYSEPAGRGNVPAYRQRKEFGENDSLTLSFPGADDVRIAVTDLLTARKR
ncbi:MAG TPA: Uma2 family endonuclease [Phycisphaerae bacterium]|nr:Uma2 family endonuclease [Phycisphaerae bacterium]